MPTRSELPTSRVRIGFLAGGGLRLALVACAWLAPAPVHAYVGPGAGLSAIGIVVGLIAAVLLGIVGFIWYPIKRLLRLRRERSEAARADAGSGGPPPKEP
jgi:hypothetical protein